MQAHFRSHNQREVSKRLKNNQLNETVKHKQWNKQYEEKVDIKREIPSLFIDPVLDMNSAKKDELNANTKYTDKLWELASKMTPYECSTHCSPPSGFLTGQPWLLKPGVERRRQGTNATFVWQVWLNGCGNSSVDGNFKLYFNDMEMTDPSATFIQIEESPLEKGKVKQVTPPIFTASHEILWEDISCKDICILKHSFSYVICTHRLK